MAHVPVLLNEALELLEPEPGKFIVDGTVDGGGHAEAIIKKIMPGGRFLGLDWDDKLLAQCRERLGEKKDVLLVHANYAELPDVLGRLELPQADGLLLDLGFSSEQLESSGRGFSFEKDEPLLMTYDDSRQPVYTLLRELSEPELADVLYELGGERYSRRIAKAIKERGRKQAIGTSGDLAAVVRQALPKGYEHGRIDPATRTFQALRIYANGELENLQTVLAHLHTIVKPGGRVAIISFHSLEDRFVKQAFQTLAKEGRAELLTKKPRGPSEEEERTNPRSRSAKIRGIIIK